MASNAKNIGKGNGKDKGKTYQPEQRPGKATPESLWSLLSSRTVEITDKGLVWEAPLPSFFPTQGAVEASAQDCLSSLCELFTPEGVLAKVLAQLLIDYRAVCRSSIGKEFDPTSWKPTLAGLRKPDELEKQLAGIEKLAAKMGLTIEDLLKRLGQGNA